MPHSRKKVRDFINRIVMFPQQKEHEEDLEHHTLLRVRLLAELYFNFNLFSPIAW